MEPDDVIASETALALLETVASVLLEVIGNMENAPDTRHAAAVALGLIGEETSLMALEKLAAKYPEVSTRKAILSAGQSSRPH